MTRAKGFSRDQARGMLLGLAVGDAVGTTVEFKQRGTFEPVTDMVGGGPFRLAPGQWTDDTSMALCLADSLVAKRGWDADDCVRRFVRWWRYGENSCTGTCFDIGITTRSALVAYEGDGNPYAGSKDSSASGNGAIMRLAPAVLAYGSSDTSAESAGVLQGRTTHASADCDLYVGRLARLLAGAALDEAEGAPQANAPAASISSSGYVRHTWEAAVWAVRRSSSFSEAILTAVNLGDDADTVGAVSGQIAGRLWGESAIPPHWLERLAWRDHITQLADALYDLEPANALPLLR